MNIKERVKKIGRSYCIFRKDHPVLVAVVDGTLCFAGGVFIAKRFIEPHYVGLPETPEDLKITEAMNNIDEAIFTDLAPEIEELVLEEGVDEGLIERFYTVPFFKGGDPANGTYDVTKYVKVLVQDTCE